MTAAAGPVASAVGSRTAVDEAAHRVAPSHRLAFAGPAREEQRPLAVEVPVQVLYGDVPFGVMMLSPADLVDFAYGFSRTEGVIATAPEIRAVEQDRTDQGLRLRIALRGASLQAHLARRRLMVGRTGCGLCGVEDLDALLRAPAPTGPAPLVTLAAIGDALAALEARQPLNASTRAVHGAAWCGFNGAVSLVREDVGRHNALDKLIGALLRADTAPADGFVLVTSRASFEMVEKVGAFGARTLVAISAPTALALERAQALDLTLVGIARHDAVTVFHGRDRIQAG